MNSIPRVTLGIALTVPASLGYAATPARIETAKKEPFGEYLVDAQNRTRICSWPTVKANRTATTAARRRGGRWNGDPGASPLRAVGAIGDGPTPRTYVQIAPESKAGDI